MCFMSKLREDVSSNPTALILYFKRSMLSCQLLISSSDTLVLISQGFLEFPYLHGDPSLSLIRMRKFDRIIAHRRIYLF